MTFHMDPELQASFVQEVASYLPKLEQSLEQCRAKPEDSEALDQARQLAHSIRAAGATVGLYALSQLAGYQESAIEQVIEGRLGWDEDLAQVLEQTTACTGDYVRSLVTGESLEPEVIGALVCAFRRLQNEPQEGDAEAIHRVIGETGQPAGVKPLEIQVLDPIHADDDLWSAFQEEAAEHFQKIEAALATLESGADTEALKNLRRSVHQMKGAAGVLGMRNTSRLNAGMQKLLDRILEENAAYRPDLFPIFQNAVALVAESVQNRATGPGLKNRVEQACSDLESFVLSTAAPAQAKPVPAPPVPFQPAAKLQDVVDAGNDLWEAFEQEAEEHLQLISDILRKTERGVPDAESIQTVRRSVHTLKGAAAIVGLRLTSSIAHRMEDLLDALYERRLAFNPNLPPLLFTTFDLITDAVAQRGLDESCQPLVDELLSRYDKAIAGATADTHAAREPEPRTPAGVPQPPAVRAEDLPADQVDAGDDLWEAFQQESEEHLIAINEILRQADRTTPEPAALQSMRRSVHTLKGACGVVGMRLTAKVAHRMEDMLDALYEGRLRPDPGHPSLLFATFDLLIDGISARGLTPEAHPRVLELFGRYDTTLAEVTPPAPDANPEASLADPAPEKEETARPAETMAAEAKPSDHKSAHYVRAPLEKVDELVRLVTELVIHRSRFEQHLSSYVHEVSELHLSIERLSRISRKLQSDYEAAALNLANRRMAFAVGRTVSGATVDFDELEFDRYTEFHLLSRDLAETTGDVSNAGSRLNDLIADFDSYLNRLGTLTSDVEDRLMRLRMLPFRTLSQRLHRTVRVTAERRDKIVDFVIDGEAVELDKTVLEEMAGPLDHLLRNAVDHGIEPPSVRRDVAKPERGTVTLRVFHEGTQVVLTLRDDGRGLDRTKLREAAVRMGYASEQDAAALSDTELYSLIFLPGFSTAKEVSDISGRGVGLDVVKDAVSKIKGTLSVTSERGVGTTFTIRLPMTMALTRVVLIKAGAETFALPLTSIAQVLRVEPEQLERVGRKPVLRLGGKIVPTMYLAEFVGQPMPAEAALAKLKAVILNIGDERLALMVDQVIEAREVAVKSLGSLLGRVHGVTGATLMGDGTVVLILNPNDMLHAQHSMGPQVRLRPAAPTVPASKDVFEVLIVDDSPSVRRVLTNLVRGTGWSPHAAKDGLEALEFIHAATARPDVVILDVEMPRMDGYEFTAALRAMYQHRNTPIIMLTSRAGDKHRKRAFEVGATEYMIKPYQDDELVGTIRRVVNKARGGDLQ